MLMIPEKSHNSNEFIFKGPFYTVPVSYYLLLFNDFLINAHHASVSKSLCFSVNHSVKVFEMHFFFLKNVDLQDFMNDCCYIY